MKIKLILIIVIIFISQTISAHPHIFINYNIDIQQDNFAIISWTFDPLTSQRNIYNFDDDYDGILNIEETENLYRDGFQNISEYGYFIRLSVGDRKYQVSSISNFKAIINDDKTLTYSFKIALPNFVGNETLAITHFDTSYFIAFPEPNKSNLKLDSSLFYKITKNVSRPYYYDPAAPADINLDTSKPKPGWEKVYPTEVIISKEPIGEDIGIYKISLKEKIVELQREIYLNLSNYLIEFQSNSSNSVIGFILLLSFIYGVVHSLGPGHRKVVISSYLLATKKTTLKEGISISMLSALLHSGSGVLLILILTKIFYKAESSILNEYTISLQAISYILLLLLSIFLIIIKIKRNNNTSDKPNSKSKKNIWLILATSFFPCPGAITIMIFSFTINMISIGIITVLSMSLGIGVTLSIISIITVKSKDLINSGQNKLFLIVSKSMEWGGLIILLLFSAFMVWTGSYLEVNSL